MADLAMMLNETGAVARNLNSVAEAANEMIMHKEKANHLFNLLDIIVEQSSSLLVKIEEAEIVLRVTGRPARDASAPINAVT